MKKAILGTKVGMTQLFLEDGRVVPVTVVEAGPSTNNLNKEEYTWRRPLSARRWV